MNSWDNVAKWYDKLVGEHGSDYHSNVIIPGALKLISPKRGEQALDVACGQGVFCRRLDELGVRVTGIDASPELINQAKQRSPKIHYLVSDAKNLHRFQDNTFDFVTCIMAIMNFDPFEPAIKEMARVIKAPGRILLVMNHPCFRIPRQSGWGFDEQRKLQYRRVDNYMTALKIPIQMQPGYDPKKLTWTYHRPLTEYFQAFQNSGLAVSRLEEWTSHRTSAPGAKKRAEDRSRNEIPLFLALLLEPVRSD